MKTEDIKNLVKAFYSYAKDKLGIDKPIKIRYITKDIKNYNDPLGKTAYYNPEKSSITLFILNRHPKDILRSFAHELTHHAQHCRGDFDDKEGLDTNDGYAQRDPHMRKMEEEAYMMGGMLVRDWSDTLKQEKDKGILDMIKENEDKEHKDVRKVKKTLDDEQAIQDMLEDRRLKLNKKLLDKFTNKNKKEDTK
jgi:hypothetical protein